MRRHDVGGHDEPCPTNVSPSSSREPTTSTIEVSDRLNLLVISEHSITTRALPPAGELRI